MTLYVTRLFHKVTPTALLLCMGLFTHTVYAGGTLQKILRTGEITIGHRKNSRPFSFADASGQPKGYSVDLCLNIVQDIRDRLQRPDLRVRFQEVNASTRITGVQNGQIDMACGTTTITKKRLQDVNFSVAFFAGGTQLMVKSSSTAKNANDLKGKKIALAANTTSLAAVQYYSNINRLGFILVEKPNQTKAFEALASGEVDAYASEDAIMWGFANSTQPRGQAARFKILPPNFDVQPYGVVHTKNDLEFSRLIDSSLIRQHRNGFTAQKYKQWFQNGKDVKTPLPMSRVMRDAIARPSKATVL